MVKNVSNWVADMRGQYRTDGVRKAMMMAGRGIFSVGWFALTTRRTFGTNIYEREWDALIILDACRVDALRAVEPEYDWLDTIDSIWSVGSSSHEWTAKTFTTRYCDEINRTGIVTANPYASKVFDDRSHPPHYYSTPFDLGKWQTVTRDDFGYSEWCFQQIHGYEDLFGSQPANHMTERAILAGREQDIDRLIVHYYQPHAPFLSDAVDTRELREVDYAPYTACRRGELSREELWENYLENLRYVLDSVELLLENLDADRVAISADHGELMGELGEYGHPEGIPHPALKKVPWATTTATDEGTYDPDPSVVYEDEYDAEERLRDLGYL